MPYKAKGKCVYKADTGKKVGCTKGPVSKYLAALHANVPDAKNEEKTKSESIQTKNTMKKSELKQLIREVIEEMGKRKNITLNGKEVEMNSIELDGVDSKDYPDYSDAYIVGAEFVDGTPLTHQELEQLESENYGLVNSLAHNQPYLQENWDWRDDPKISRDFEKSDVSQDEFERSRGYGRYSGGRGRYSGQRTVASPMRITFFNVPAGKESEATKAGLTQFKSGKWGFKHNFDPQVVSVASDREKSAVSDAEKIFGKGRYWEPNS